MYMKWRPLLILFVCLFVKVLHLFRDKMYKMVGLDAWDDNYNLLPNHPYITVHCLYISLLSYKSTLHKHLHRLK